MVSGTRGDHIFYERFLFGDPAGVVHAYCLDYSRRLQARYGPITPRLSASLRWRTVRADR